MAQQYNNTTSYGGSGYGSSNPYDTDGSYGNPPPAYGGGVEMQPLTHNGAPYSSTPEPRRDPNQILNDCRAVGRAIDDLESRLQELQRLQRTFVSSAGVSNKDVDALSADIMSGYRGLADRVKRIKGQPDAGNPRNKPQVEALDRRIRKAIQSYQQTEAAFRKEVQEQQRRQFLIVRPDATESEIREATESGGDTQIFQQALMQSDRRGQSQSTLRNVQQRHDAIQQIERTMIELQQLFQDLDAIVVQQDVAVQDIEVKAEETYNHIEAGNVHLDKGVSSARAARKKKWICLGIVGEYMCRTTPTAHADCVSSGHHPCDRPHHYNLRCYGGRLVQEQQQQQQQYQQHNAVSWARVMCFSKILPVLFLFDEPIYRIVCNQRGVS